MTCSVVMERDTLVFYDQRIEPLPQDDPNMMGFVFSEMVLFAPAGSTVVFDPPDDALPSAE